jgi:hypothetical protein
MTERRVCNFELPGLGLLFVCGFQALFSAVSLICTQVYIVRDFYRKRI